MLELLFTVLEQPLSGLTYILLFYEQVGSLMPHSLPDLPALDMKLRILSKRVLAGAPINNKTFRKTWESWLVFYYPDKALQIALRQGHTTTTQYEHYLNIPFEDADRKEMRK